MLDFYDPTSLSSATDADLKKRMEISEAFLISKAKAFIIQNIVINYE